MSIELQFEEEALKAASRVSTKAGYVQTGDHIKAKRSPTNSRNVHATDGTDVTTGQTHNYTGTFVSIVEATAALEMKYVCLGKPSLAARVPRGVKSRRRAFCLFGR